MWKIGLEILRSDGCWLKVEFQRRISEKGVVEKYDKFLRNIASYRRRLGWRQIG